MASGIAGYVLAQFTVPSSTTFTATNSGGGPTTCTITPGTYTIDTLCTEMQTQLNTRTPSNWTCTVSLSGTSNTGQVTINWTGTGTYSVAFTSTSLRDFLGFTGNLTAVTQGVSSTGSKQAQSLWIPDCTLFTDGDRKRAPMCSDLRTTVSPRGKAYGLIGNTYYRHTNVTWAYVPIAKTWEAEAVLSNASWEFFFKTTQMAQGSSWFGTCSALTIYDHSSTKMGGDSSIAGWTITGLDSIEPKRSGGSSWTGMWTVQIPELITDG